MRYRTTILNDQGVTERSFEYIWVDGKLISLVYVSGNSTNTAKYLYNEFDEPVGMVITDATGSALTYYYLKNAQGDITNIVSATGEKLISFSYDVFGKVTEVYHTDASIVRLLTPFGYRGYCYDTFTGLYYLQSRYYDPNTGRFINADDTNYLNVTGTVLGCNLFAYCENDPVNRVDPRGCSYESEQKTGIIVAIISIIFAFIILFGAYKGQTAEQIEDAWFDANKDIMEGAGEDYLVEQRRSVTYAKN